MLKYIKISKRPRILYRLTGLTIEQFTALCTKLKPLWEKAEKKRLSQRERKRALGQGRKYKLSAIEDKLLFILVFYRYYLTDELMGYLFAIHPSNACRLRIKMEPLVEKAADPSLSQSIRRRISPDVKKVSTLEELLVVCPDFAEVVTDATEQQRRRPKKRIQKKYYSGKKKRHTIKTQITINTKGKILMASKSYPGSVHDYNIFKQENTAEKLSQKSSHYVDCGYDGAPNDYPECTIIMPVKRRKNHPALTRAEKRFNRKHSRIRILVEHVLSRMKKYQILAQVYRHKIMDYNQRFRNIAALVNFRLASAAI